MMARRGAAVRPARPAPECPDCGAEVWQAWSLYGKCWIALAPRRYPLEGQYGTYEVWRDAHGGLLAAYLEHGARGDQEGSWRGVHHNASCGTWARDTAAALVAEARAVLPVLTEDELLALGGALRDLGARISAEIRGRALPHTDA
ncbi:hypothetical protein BRM3_09065 [Brachybacterium huguangmaarense]|uniref:Uncharacterized protein n=1 Tax=Brachybacterium huguangmaarense TaxID=1652028 RepID=A0ABY6FY82_9MICO|nr:hypothetical protein [Brachybacterium huguangmaarense]UYG15795.1 hypothetical protein BRM3_09065 [Brachybacterium huguangmaarense]